MPAVTVTRPPAASARASITAPRSSALRLPASPMVPLPTSPVTPASSRPRAFRASASRSTLPLASKGVVTAGITPGNRMGLSIARLNVRCGPCPRHRRQPRDRLRGRPRARARRDARPAGRARPGEGRGGRDDARGGGTRHNAGGARRRRPTEDPPRGSARAAGETPAAPVRAAIDGAGGRPDVLVNNAGVYPGGRASEIDFDVVESTWQANAAGAWRVAVAALPTMREGARIVNVSSGAGSLT